MVTPALFEEKAGGEELKDWDAPQGRKAGQAESNHHCKFRILTALRNGGCSVRPFNASGLFVRNSGVPTRILTGRWIMSSG
jgi:hypothetical protein